MLRRGLLYLAMLSGCCCASIPSTGRGQAPIVDTEGVLVVAMRFGFAHACPIEDGSIALTAGHVVDSKPFDDDASLYPSRWSSEGHSGIFVPIRAMRSSDLASVQPASGKFPHPYPLAKTAPETGSRVWIVGFDYSSKSRALGRKVYSARVLRIEGDVLILDTDAKPGSSGSCVLNDASEVVGIVSFGFSALDDSSTVTGAPGVWSGLAEVDMLKEAPTGK